MIMVCKSCGKNSRLTCIVTLMFWIMEGTAPSLKPSIPSTSKPTLDMPTLLISTAAFVVSDSTGDVFKLKWEFKTNGNISQPILISSNGGIFIGSTDMKLYRLSEMGKILWIFHTDCAKISAISVNKDKEVIYVGCTFDSVSGGTLYAIDKQKGFLLWSILSPNSGFSSPVFDVTMSGTIYVGSFDKYIYALKSVDGSVMGKYSTSKPEYEVIFSIH